MPVGSSLEEISAKPASMSSRASSSEAWYRQSVISGRFSGKLTNVAHDVLDNLSYSLIAEEEYLLLRLQHSRVPLQLHVSLEDRSADQLMCSELG